MNRMLDLIQQTNSKSDATVHNCHAEEKRRLRRAPQENHPPAGATQATFPNHLRQLGGMYDCGSQLAVTIAPWCQLHVKRALVLHVITVCVGGSSAIGEIGSKNIPTRRERRRAVGGERLLDLGNPPE